MKAILENLLSAEIFTYVIANSRDDTVKQVLLSLFYRVANRLT